MRPHRNAGDATLVLWLLQNSSCSTQQSIWDHKEMVLIAFKTKLLKKKVVGFGCCVVFWF